MARLTAAAGLVLATLLMCVALGAAEQTIESVFAAWFRKGSLPEPVGIYCKQAAALNVAVRDGKVVLAYDDCNDLSQKWYPLYTLSPRPISEPIELKPFSLLNAETYQVITIPSGNFQKVGLSGAFDIGAANEELWTPAKTTRPDRFFQLFAKNTALTLNGLLGNVHDGTEVGIYYASPDSENAIWQMTSYPACYP